MTARRCQCGAPATTTVERVRDAAYAERVVCSVHGVLTAADFVRVPMCADCSERGQ